MGRVMIQTRRTMRVLAVASALLLTPLACSSRAPARSAEEETQGRREEPSVERATQPPRVHPTCALHVELTGVDDRPRLEIVLLNDGASPVVVDRELLIPVSIHLRTVEGEVPLERQPHRCEPNADAAYWRQRFTTVEPGRSVRRTVVRGLSSLNGRRPWEPGQRMTRAGKYTYPASSAKRAGVCRTPSAWPRSWRCKCSTTNAGPARSSGTSAPTPPNWVCTWARWSRIGRSPVSEGTTFQPSVPGRLRSWFC